MATRKPNFSALFPAHTQQQIADLLPMFGNNKTQLVMRAIDLLHNQEIQTTMNTETELVYRIPTNEDYYTQETTEEYLVAGLLDNQETKIAAFLAEHFAGMTYEIERVPETQSYNNRSKAHSERAEQAIEALENYIEAQWYNWWPEPTE